MSVNYSIEGELVKLCLDGEYSPGDVMSQFVKAINDPKCPNPAALMIDVRKSDMLATRPAGDIQRIAEFAGPYKDRFGGRCAVVAETDVHFGLARLGAVYGEGVGLDAQVFRTEDEALEWLGVMGR